MQSGTNLCVTIMCAALFLGCDARVFVNFAMSYATVYRRLQSLQAGWQTGMAAANR